MTAPSDGIVLALSGGVGGAKLALGLSHVVAADRLVVIANTGDDFEHLGLSISPDLDTLMYALAGLDNPETGWGRRDETWTFMAAIEALGGESWFRLGDSDLATHVERTRRLRAGHSLSDITADLASRLGVAPKLLPMSDDPVRTRVRTAEGWLDFQDYFVRRRCAPAVLELAFDGAATARPQPELLRLLSDRSLRAVIICPSNPFISIGPILALPGLHEALRRCPAPVIAVSPIIGDRAVKGPTAKMMRELGMPVSPASVARHYGDLIDCFVADDEDGASLSGLDTRIVLTRVLMQGLADRVALAARVLRAADALRSAAALEKTG